MRKALRGLVRRERSSAGPPAAATSLVAAPRTPTPNEGPAADAGMVKAASNADDTVALQTSPGSNSGAESLWSRAYKDLLEREPELVADYARHIGTQQDGGSDGDQASALASPKAVKTLLERLQDDREKKQWRFSMRGNDHKVRDQLEKLVKLLTLSDAVIKQALSAQPYAALAWSAVSVFLPLLSGSYTKDAAMIQGFATIADLQAYWKNWEDIYLESESSKHYQSLAEPLSKLYSHMLEYQIQAICQLSKKQLSRAWQKIAGQVDWAAKEKNILELSNRCMAFIDPLKEKEIRERSITQNRNLESIYKAETEILETMKDQNRSEKEEKLLGALKVAAGNYRGGMDYNPDPVNGTCEWFFADPAFLGWRDARGAGVFWLTAGPGCGKSVLARTLITNDHLQGTTTTVVSTGETARIANSNTSVCYFFFKDGVQEQTRITAALCAVIHRLLTQQATDHLRSEGIAAYAKNGSALTQSFDDLWNLLLDCARSAKSGELICVLDALDECDSRDRQRLIDKIDRLYTDGTDGAAKNLKFFVTSRAYDDIEESFHPFANRAEYFRFDADDRHASISHDIGLVIDARLDTFARGFAAEDRRRIRDHLMSRGTKTYLWLHLTLDIIKRRPSRHGRVSDVESLLTSLPVEVSDAYEKILNRYSGSEHSGDIEDDMITTTLLQIVLTAARPLTLIETNYALTMALAGDEIDTHAKLEEQLWKSDFKSTVKNLCSLFISVYDDKVFFIHLTAREFLLEKPRSGLTPTKWRGRFANPDTLHETISRCCMRYLLLKELSTRRIPLLESNRGQYPLLEYAACHWPDHQRVHKRPNRPSVLWARELCSLSGDLARLWVPIYIDNQADRKPWLRTAMHACTDLVFVSFLGLLGNVHEFLEEGYDVNAHGGNLGTPLQAAVYGEREAVVELLLANHADIHANKGRLGYPLQMAALEQPNRARVSQLLSHGANPLQEIYGIGLPLPGIYITKPFLGCEKTTILEAVACAGLVSIFKLLAAEVVDISTPQSKLEALENPAIVRYGPYSRAVLASLIIEEGGDEDHSLMDEMFRDLMDLPTVAENMLHTIQKQSRLHQLIEPKKLKRMARVKNAAQLLNSFLQEANWPCPEISNEVLKAVAGYYDAATFRAFYRASGLLAPNFSDLLIAASRHGRRSCETIELILGIVDEEFEIDDRLIFNLSNTSAVTPLMVDFVKPTALNARILIHGTLTWSSTMLDAEETWGTSPSAIRGMERHDIVRHIIKWCEDPFDADDGLLLATVDSGNLKVLQVLLPFYSGGSLPITAMLRNVVSSSGPASRSIMDFLLRTYGATEIDGQDIIIEAMKREGTPHAKLAAFLCQFQGDIRVTPTVLASVTCYSTIESLARRFGRQALDEIASDALHLAVDGEEEHRKAFEPLLQYFPGSSFRGVEDIVLGVLDLKYGNVYARMALLITKLGDQITVSERILAASSEYGSILLTMIERWRPSSRHITDSLVEATAAMGSVDALKHMEKKTDGNLNVAKEYYRFAEFRKLIREGDEDEKIISSYWENGAAVADVPDAYGRTTLHLAAKNPDITTNSMKFLLQVSTADVNARDWKGRTALYYAAYSSIREPKRLIQPLLDAGADATIADQKGRTPISHVENMIWLDPADKDMILAALKGNGGLEEC